MDQLKGKKFLNRLARIVLKTVLCILVFFLLIGILVQTPPVQNLVRKKAVAWLEKKLQTKVEVGRIYVGLAGKITLANIYIEDREKDTLLSGGSLQANVNLGRLIFRSELDLRKLELENITAKIRRQLPDTIFNYQFIVDAFIPPDTSSSFVKDSTSTIIAIPSIVLNNVRLVYNDVITGSEMQAMILHLDTKIDKLDATNFIFDIPQMNIDGLTARVYQVKPLATPDPLAKDIAEAKQPSNMHLNFKDANLKNIKVDYRNDVSATYANLNVGSLNVKLNRLDLTNRIIELENISLDNSITAIRLGKKEAARVVKEEVKQEVESQVIAGWRIEVASLNLNNNYLQFDDDNTGRIRNGMDYAHLKADSFTLQANNILFSKDSIAGDIQKASFKEQSGFVLQELQTNFLYANNEAYLKDLLLKTPGTELKRYALLKYSSYEALANSFDRTQMDVDISQSHVQVKDILTFAPQLRSNPAFANPNEVWHLNLQGTGTLASLHIQNLQFSGLKNTQIDAKGSLASINNANNAGARLIIRKLHTTQTDIALFTRQRLSNDQINLPEEFDASGTLAGSINKLSADVNIYSSVGNVSVRGQFTNLSKPAAVVYTAQVKTNSLNLGSILRNNQLGSTSGNIAISGKGFTPDNFDAKFKGSVYSLGFNNYSYRNIELNGNVRQSAFTVYADINDPNVDLNGTSTGKISSVNTSFRFVGSIDSVKTMPLHFTDQPVVVRGQIDADIPVMNAKYVEGNILMTKALFVSKDQRLPLDTIRLAAGRNDSVQFITLASDVANARLSGQYRYSELGSIFQNSIQPYFSIVPGNTTNNLQPYRINFAVDIASSPILAAFVPGLKTFEPIHAEGSVTNAEGLNAVATTAYIVYQGNEISGLNLKINTTTNGLQFTGDIQRLKSASTLDLYHTGFTATALNNKIDFSLNIDDANARDKYYVSGILSQPSPGIYTLNLKPDSLLLNYERWAVLPNNSITITKNNIIGNLTLQKNEQQLILKSLPDVNQSLNVDFTNFRLATITGFMRADSLLVDGSMNGTITFKNILKQPVFTSDLAINNLSLKKDTIGNLKIKVDNTSGDRYNTNATITGRGNDIVLTGSFAPQGSSDIAMDLQLAIRQMQLSTMEGALGGYLKNASGTVNGNITIGGTISEPKINGPLNFDKASFALSMLGSQFRVDGEKITVTENGFDFNDFVIRDTANNTLTLNGIVRTPNFIDYSFDMAVHSVNFKVLSTTKKQSKTYYGDLVISSDLQIYGTDKKPIVDGAITVNDGTKLTIVVPEKEPGVVEREGIVEFVDMDTPENDSLFLAFDSLNNSQIKGLDITVNIEVKKEAIFNIVIDEANGDFLSLQGEALISTGIDPSGKITMVGNYELEKGAYEITFNFLHRRFDIQKGSKITWLNEPTKATMDVLGVYIANTSPIDLVQNQIDGSTPAIRNTYLQKLPFEVRLHLTGEILEPKVDFDIVLPADKNYGVSNDIITQVDTRLEQLRQDPGEINKQVFALLLLNRFVGQNPLASSSPLFNAESYVRQSVSKLLTGELNHLASGLIDGVDLTFDVSSTDDYTTGERRNRTDLNIGISKRLLNERLTITAGSNLELDGPKNSNQKASNVIGNLAVNYSLSKDGRYALRFYRKNEYQGAIDGYIIETGMSFIITVDYNRFKELLRRRKQKVETISTTTTQNHK
jgi:hypothetical protein